MVAFAIESNLEDIAAIYGRMAESTPGLLAVEMTSLALKIQAVGTETIAHHTPVGDERNTDSSAPYSHLWETTLGAMVADEKGALITWRQTKTIPIKGEDVPLWGVLTDGRIGGYEVRAKRPAFALFWPGMLHFTQISHPGPAAPIPYVDEALAEMIPAFEALGAESMGSILAGVLTVMH